MRQTALLLGTLLFTSSAFAVDPRLLNLVMPDAKVLAGVNASSVRSSPFGQFLISKIGSLGQNSHDFTALTGFDPLQDVFEILAATPGDPAQHSGLILASGNFKVDQIVSALGGRTNPVVQTYGGATLIVPAAPKNGVASAFALLSNGSIAVAGDLASVRAAIDRANTPNAPVLDGTLALRVNSISSAEDEWLVSVIPVAKLIPASAYVQTGPVAQAVPILKNIQSFSGGIKFGSDVHLSGQIISDTAANASALSAVVGLVITLASANAGADPHLAQLLQVLQPLKLSSDGTAINLDLSIPESQIEAFASRAPSQSAPTAAPRHREPLRRR